MAARKVIHDGPVNTAVMAWMRGQGIKPEDVRGYTLTYDAGDLMTIDIRMYMTDEVPKPADPPFVADKSGQVWKYDAPRDGYRFMIGGAVRPLDYIREHYGIAEFQPPHATCIITIGANGPIAYACGAGCPKSRPKRVIDNEGDEFHHQGDGVYRMELRGGGFGVNTYTLDEIGEHSVIEE